MNGFKQLLAAYLAAHQNTLPQPDPGEEVRIDREGTAWKVSVRSGGELFDSTVDCEQLLGWIWLQQCGQPD